MVIAKLVFSGSWPRISLLPASAIAVGGYVYTVTVPTLFRIGGSCVVFLVPLVAALAMADIKGTTSPFRGRIMVWLGDLTYAFYILHTLVLTWSYRWLVAGKHLSPGVAALLLLGMFVLSLALSWALFTFVEQPMMRRFSRPRRRPQVPTPAPVTPTPVLATAQATE
jgi:peptidoglycan/LPS O-acetylase OafA/YrhL